MEKLVAVTLLGVLHGSLFKWLSSDARKMLKYLDDFESTDNEDKFEFTGKVSSPVDIVFLTQKKNKTTKHDIPNNNRYGLEDGAQGPTQNLKFYVHPEAHVMVKYDVAGDDITTSGQVIQAAYLVGPSEMTILGNKKGKFVDVRWVSTRSPMYIRGILEQDIQQCAMQSVGAAVLSLALLITYY